MDCARKNTLKRLLIVVNVDWFFLSHRLPVALAARDAGYQVHLATTLTQDRKTLEAYGLIVHPLWIDRGASSVSSLIWLFYNFVRLFLSVRPDVLHLVTIKPILVGGLAARFTAVHGVVYAVSGLGHVFIAQGRLQRLRRWLISGWYRIILRKSNMRIIFQNPQDRTTIESILDLAPEQIVMIRGSGVDLSEYQQKLLPDGVPVVFMAARLLETKGVREFVESARLLRQKGLKVKFWLAGAPDLANPASIRQQELDGWRDEGVVQLLGNREDIPQLMAQSQIIALPSYYGEGLPKVLIEAAACGRAVVTTDMPGCRDAVEAEVTGVLVPPRDVNALAQALERLLRSRELCTAMGHAGRKRAERLFDINIVIAEHLKIYHALLESRENF